MKLTRTVATLCLLSLSASPAVSADESPRFYSGETPPQRAGEIVLPGGGINDVIALPDGRLLAAGADGTLRLMPGDFKGGGETFATLDEPAEKLLLLPGRQRVLSIAGKSRVTIWQLPQQQRGWGPEQATGPPNSSPGDMRTAWASATEDAQAEWLLLEYAAPVEAAEIVIHENHNPGAVERIVALGDDREAVAWTRPDDAQQTAGPTRELRVPVVVDFAVTRVRVEIDSERVTGWNEIDAVGLIDATGATHWAARAAASSTYAERPRRSRFVTNDTPRTPPPTYEIPAGAVAVGHGDGSVDGKHSYGGSGHAIMFTRPEGATRLAAIEVFGSRYGMSQPPDEDFRVYLLDSDQQVLHELTYPYAMFERGEEKWCVLGVDGVEVPEHFGIGLFFNAHRTKGVYVGKNETGEPSHSLIGTPKLGYEPVQEPWDWMVRVHMVE